MQRRKEKNARRKDPLRLNNLASLRENKAE
jgi:hypothetical protein